MSHPSGLPVLAVVYGRGAATPLGLLDTARGRCTPVFLGDLTDPQVAADLATLPKTTSVVDTAACVDEQLCSLVADLGAAGVITFSDSLLRVTATVAEALGLPFHARDTAAVLVDKFRQRRTLAAAGVQTTACRLIRSAEDLAPALTATGLPAVIKPRSGCSSMDTCRVDSEEELAAQYAEFTSGVARPREYVLEEYLAGDPTAVGEFWGDYVSVESVIREGDIRTAGVTGKLPLAFPFRETGLFVPAALADELVEQVIRLERRALRALGVREGVTHTEIKFTPEGPRVIEVNGRIGGGISDILKRSAGVDLLAHAVEAALGAFDPPEPVTGLGGPGRRKVAFQYLMSPPSDDRAPGGDELIDDLYDIPGVELVDASIDPRWRADWRAGTEWILGTVYGSAPGFAELQVTLAAVQRRMETFWSETQA
ncbi:ATP-grasp domain-containing protein [Streptomyces europaeiscabiei]|uniref:ATP-grasp domain-containing protein n=1 Tax=Streptomyces europaeiscabiei TaxID=146819 RepID=A0AAJ2PHR1_9ACTN|nr:MULTISPECIES: ATP-grasp domain-containing protein [Streptomyces]MDX3128268.1 ATP-grasp domain-containing protein [Streptomyces europaeiscabiei]